MTPEQANELIAYLRSGDNKCLLPKTCDSPYCRAWKALIAYIRMLDQTIRDDQTYIRQLEMENEKAYEQSQEERLRYSKLAGAISQYLGALQNELERAGVV